MALPNSNISFSAIANELKRPGTQVSLGQADVRSLAGKTSGQISVSDFKGKSGMYESFVTLTYNVGTGAGSIDVKVIDGLTINYIYNGSSPSGVVLNFMVAGTRPSNYVKSFRIYSADKATLIWHYTEGTSGHSIYQHSGNTYWKFLAPGLPTLSGRYFIQIETRT